MYRLLALVLCFHSTRSQFDTGMSGDRRVVVQLFEWPFNDIKEECKNVLGPQKFGAVLVSPIAENVVIKLQSNGKTFRPWYERYQPLSWKIITRSGSEQEFKEMVGECNKNDVRVYVDVVLNHGVYNQAGQPSGEVVGVGGTRANVKTKNYPGLGFDKSNFHDPCYLDDFNKTAVRVCELWGLQDINQTQTYVQGKIVTFLNKLISFGVAGFRIDAAKHMWPEDLVQIYKQLNDVVLNGGKSRMRPFWTLEVIDDGSYQEDYKDIGSEYDFGFFGMVAEAFKNGSLSLSRIYAYAKKPGYLSKTLQALSSNQDMQRYTWPDEFRDSSDRSGVQQAIDAFVLTFSRDVPNIMSSYSYRNRDEGPPSDESDKIFPASGCTDGWLCEHRFKPLQWIIKFFTNVVKDAPIEAWWSDWGDSSIQAAFTRGQKGFAAFNADTKELRKTFKVSLPPGVYCDLATGYYCHHHQMCMGWLKRKVEVKKDGTVEISLPGIIRSTPISSRNIGDLPPEPPYLVISVESMYPSVEEPNEVLAIVGWVLLGVAVIFAIGLVTWFLRKQAASKREIDVRP